VDVVYGQTVLGFGKCKTRTKICGVCSKAFYDVFYTFSDLPSAFPPLPPFLPKTKNSFGRRLDYYEKKRKKEAREPHKRSAVAKKLIGLKAKLYAKKRHSEKVRAVFLKSRRLFAHTRLTFFFKTQR
jgi:hypothetical protein|tara:strand:+ start:276 stop:656 length:381 start_codon:yes stop_codon:yes gene_type:complete